MDGRPPEHFDRRDAGGNGGARARFRRSQRSKAPGWALRDSAAFAYAWSLAVVESIIDSGGVSDISRLLDRVATAPSTEAAAQEMLHSNYADLQAADRRVPQARIPALTGNIF